MDYENEQYIVKTTMIGHNGGTHDEEKEFFSEDEAIAYAKRMYYCPSLLSFSVLQIRHMIIDTDEWENEKFGE